MFDKFSKGFYFSPDGDGKGGGAPLDPPKSPTGDLEGKNNGEGTYETFDAYLAKQPEPIRKLYEVHSTGLLNSVKATRDERDNALKLIKELTPKAEKGSEMETALKDLTGKLEAADKRANFAEEAIKPEIGCTNVKAAFAIATSEELFDKRGLPNWDAIKKTAPELFRKPGKAQGNAGDGTGDGANTGISTMNDVIRHMAGRK